MSQDILYNCCKLGLSPACSGQSTVGKSRTFQSTKLDLFVVVFATRGMRNQSAEGGKTFLFRAENERPGGDCQFRAWAEGGLTLSGCAPNNPPHHWWYERGYTAQRARLRA